MSNCPDEQNEDNAEDLGDDTDQRAHDHHRRSKSR
jgi:hypothetical protein